MRRFASPSPAGGGTGPDMARILPASRPGREKTHLHRLPVVADLASPRRSTPPARRKGVIGRMWRCFGWGCLLVIFRGGKIRGRGLQKSRWRVRSVCIVPTHPDGQDCDILRYCALFSILNGALRLAMAHRPPDLVALFRVVFEPCWCGMVRPNR